jgi:hypothetical protein
VIPSESGDSARTRHRALREIMIGELIGLRKDIPCAAHAIVGLQSDRFKLQL